MKKNCVHITFYLFLFSLSFAGQKAAGNYSAAGYAAIKFDQLSLVEETENVVERRKRAHKRKRQIRPRRNGF